MLKHGRWIAVLLAALILAGCGGAAMVREEKPVVATRDKALVVMMRSTFVGSAISASVFDVTGPESKFVGIVNNGTKLGYHLPPGEHNLMVIGESADFMKVKVAAGKTYYALITPRIGVWKARFSFRPLRLADLASNDFATWDRDTYFVSNSPDTLSWAQSNAPSIAEKRAEYWPEWTSKPEEQRASQTLNVEDGR